MPGGIREGISGWKDEGKSGGEARGVKGYGVFGKQSYWDTCRLYGVGELRLFFCWRVLGGCSGRSVPPMDLRKPAVAVGRVTRSGESGSRGEGPIYLSFLEFSILCMQFLLKLLS